MLSVFLSLQITLAQQRAVTGVVTNEQGQAIANASVKIRSQAGGTTTDADGKFSIQATDQNVLVISSVGYLVKEQPVSSQSFFQITLLADNKSLDEVVVIGYGTASRKDVTGAISSVKAEQLENENPQSVADLLKGNIAGLSVSQNTSAKGGGDLLVRGKTTLSASTAPLIVLDGIIYNGQISDINPNTSAPATSAAHTLLAASRHATRRAAS